MQCGCFPLQTCSDLPVSARQLWRDGEAIGVDDLAVQYRIYVIGAGPQRSSGTGCPNIGWRNLQSHQIVAMGDNLTILVPVPLSMVEASARSDIGPSHKH